MKQKIYISIIILLVPFLFLPTSKNDPPLEAPIINLKINKDIIKIPLEEYLIGVVGAEVPALFHIEALKAQAIAARTFALYIQNQNSFVTLEDQAYATNEELHQKWQDDYQNYYDKIKSAVMDTNGLVLTYNDKIIKSYYYSMSNGYTSDSQSVFNESLPYIESTSSIYDNSSLKNFEVTTILSKDEFCQKLNISCINLTISTPTLDSSNRVEYIYINNQKYLGTQLRKLLNLRSTDFNITINNEVIITTRGYGHGVGMSQYGANGMAKSGSSYKQILNHYYKNIKIEKYKV